MDTVWISPVIVIGPNVRSVAVGPIETRIHYEQTVTINGRLARHSDHANAYDGGADPWVDD